MHNLRSCGNNLSCSKLLKGRDTSTPLLLWYRAQLNIISHIFLVPPPPISHHFHIWLGPPCHSQMWFASCPTLWQHFYVSFLTSVAKTPSYHRLRDMIFELCCGKLWHAMAASNMCELLWSRKPYNRIKTIRWPI